MHLSLTPILEEISGASKRLVISSSLKLIGNFRLSLGESINSLGSELIFCTLDAQVKKPFIDDNILLIEEEEHPSSNFSAR